MRRSAGGGIQAQGSPRGRCGVGESGTGRRVSKGGRIERPRAASLRSPLPWPDSARSTAADPCLSAGDMHDFFVGLMGKRTSEPDDPTEGNKETFAGAGDPRHSPNAQ
uniref:Neurokinin-B n=1 Tax=Pelusios castaneus TaxID=367368 RepID=A0A8C8RMR1_9SAUR